MPLSLKRTWVALAIAAAAVLVVAFLAGRDFVRDVLPECAATLEPEIFVVSEATRTLTPVALDRSGTPSVEGLPDQGFQLRYDTKIASSRFNGSAREYSNVRIVWTDMATDGKPCACGTVPVYMSGEAPSDLNLFRGGHDLYIVKGRSDIAAADPSNVRMAFRVKQGTARQLQNDRIFTARHLSLLIVWFAFGALAVAVVRARRAMSYALRMHTWTEAKLDDDGMIADDGGATIATLEQGRVGVMPAGPILVAPSALSTSGLYRDMPIVAYGNVAEGDHARWGRGTMLRLRDARALAIISTLSTLAAFSARLIA